MQIQPSNRLTRVPGQQPIVIVIIGHEDDIGFWGRTHARAVRSGLFYWKGHDKSRAFAGWLLAVMCRGADRRCDGRRQGRRQCPSYSVRPCRALEDRKDLVQVLFIETDSVILDSKLDMRLAESGVKVEALIRSPEWARGLELQRIAQRG